MARFENLGGEKPEINFAAGLQSARKSLDGKQMDNGTVGCVEAVTKILSHVHPEFKKMVDDGVVNTVEGENSLHSRLEKMGVEIIPFDESKVSQGDIIFYDGKQTYQHVLVADHKDADDNWRVFGNSSSANKIMEQPLYQGQTPAWIVKVSNLQGNTAQGNVRQQNRQTEPSKPLFDLNAQDSTTQNLLAQFANERFAKAVNDEDVPIANFFNGMFDDINHNSVFQNTPENREAIIERYGEELNEFIQNNQPAQTQTQAQPQPVNNKPSRPEIKAAANRFLEVLRANNSSANAKIGLRLNNALQSNNFVEVENILKQNGVAISAPGQNQSQQTQPSQPQAEPVSNNTPPQNILIQPAKTSGNENLIKRASKSVTSKTSHNQKTKIGNAIIQLANQTGIAVTGVDFKSLQNGSSQKIQEWQAKLSAAGAFTISSTQEQSAQPAQEKPLSLKERANQIEINAAREQWEGIKQGYKNIQTARKISAGLYGNFQGTANEQGNIRNNAIENDFEDFHVQTPQEIQAAQEREHEVQEQQRINRLLYSDIDSGEWQENNFSAQKNTDTNNYDDDPESFIAPISKRDIQQAKRIQRQSRKESPQTQPQVRPQVQPQEKTASAAQERISPEKALRQVGITKSTYTGRWTAQARPSEEIQFLDSKYPGKWFAFIDNRVDNIRRGTGAARRESNENLLNKISGKIDKVLELYGGKRLTDYENNDSFVFNSQESAEDFTRALNIYFGNESFSKDEVSEPQVQQSAQPEAQPQSKKKLKGKWHTVGSAGSREALQDLIREKFYNKNLTIEDDGTVRDPQSGKQLNYVVRNNKGRWQLGEYEESEPQTKPQAQSTVKEAVPANKESAESRPELTEKDIALMDLTPENG
ncbi:MAG: hypothetical protein IJL14_10165 [Selenomonadaceae bacterium]|nr:hypothetical protein [Selenomonadaceae bacterium]